jgi:plasmid stabilization system protein ParE
VNRTVTPSHAALQDLANIRDWLRQPGSGRKAKATLNKIAASIDQLKRTPIRWRQGEHPDTREIFVEGYRIVYDVIPDSGDNATAGNVRVLRVFGPGQDTKNL